MNVSDTSDDRRGAIDDGDGTGRTRDVVIVGGGVAGLSAGIFTARAGLDTLIVDDADRGSILRRNAHLENFPGFPAGVNTRLFLDMTEDQAERAGCSFFDGVVTEVERAENSGFDLALEGGGGLEAERVIAASWADSGYLDGLDIEVISAARRASSWRKTTTAHRPATPASRGCTRPVGSPTSIIRRS